MDESKEFDFDDLPVTDDVKSSRNLFDVYLESKSALNRLRKERKVEYSSEEIGKFFKVMCAYKDRGGALFRKMNTADEALSLLWLTRVYEQATYSISMDPIATFESFKKDDLEHIGSLNFNINNIPQIGSILREKGIVLVIEPSIRGMKVDGAILLINKVPVIGISLRYSRVDSFWFTLMHELSHLVLHYDRLDEPIIDDFDETSDELIELQANRLARDSLISRSVWRTCDAKYSRSVKDLQNFAIRNHVHPAIVAGRLQRELDDYSLFANIVNKVNVRELLLGE